MIGAALPLLGAHLAISDLETAIDQSKSNAKQHLFRRTLELPLWSFRSN
jgi:hypothetical protein